MLLPFDVFSWMHGIKFGLLKFLHQYFLKEHDKDRGRMMDYNHSNRLPILTSLKMHDWGWKDKFIWVRSSLFGANSVVPSVMVKYRWLNEAHFRSLERIV